MPDIQSTAATVSTPQTRATLPTTSTSSLNSSAAIQDARNLAEAFNLLSRYGDEFMDDHPLIGEPGSFIISKKSAELPVTTRLLPVKQVKPDAQGTGTIGKPGTSSATPEIKTDAATIGIGKAGKGAEKTPVTPSSAGGGGKEKVKRRKSKVGAGVS